MAVRDVFAPKAENISDVTETKKKDDSEVGEWQKKAREAKSRLEYAEAQRMIDRITSPEPPPESPFQIKGSMDLGHIDFQEQQRLARESAEIAQKDASDKVAAARGETDKLREDLHNAQLLMIQQTLNSKIEQLQRSVDAGMTQKNFGQQVAEIRELASELGYRKDDSPPVGAGNVQLQLEMLKLQMMDKQQDREFKWKLRQDEKNFQLEIQKMNDLRAAQAAELERQRNRDDMWANFPKHIGSAISKGLIDSEGVASQPKSKNKAYHVEAGEGESGEVECDNCHQPVAIGSTARKAVCANCGTSYSVTRIKKEPKDVYEPEEE